MSTGDARHCYDKLVRVQREIESTLRDMRHLRDDARGYCVETQLQTGDSVRLKRAKQTLFDSSGASKCPMFVRVVNVDAKSNDLIATDLITDKSHCWRWTGKKDPMKRKRQQVVLGANRDLHHSECELLVDQFAVKLTIKNGRRQKLTSSQRTRSRMGKMAGVSLPGSKYVPQHARFYKHPPPKFNT